MKEQGYICAYCMCRIPVKEHDIGIPRVKIEHIRSQSAADEEYSGLDYYNMVAVCNGNAAKKMHLKYLTCDAHKGDRTLSKVNPLKPETLETIYYTFCRNLLEDYEKEKEIHTPFVGIAEWYLKEIIAGIE